jgi:hypothetical protein
MVEYAVLLASTSLRGFAVTVGTWAEAVDRRVVGYALLALVVTWLAMRAFRRSEF